MLKQQADAKKSQSDNLHESIYKMESLFDAIRGLAHHDGTLLVDALTVSTLASMGKEMAGGMLELLSTPAAGSA